MKSFYNKTIFLGTLIPLLGTFWSLPKSNRLNCEVTIFWIPRWQVHLATLTQNAQGETLCSFAISQPHTGLRTDYIPLCLFSVEK